MVVACCCLATILALVLGVGMASHLVLRHVVQTLPFWPAVILGLRGRPQAGCASLASFISWIGLMALIWLHLLGIAHAISGNFSAWEIAMTLIVGASCAIGIAAFVPSRSALPPLKATMVFIGLLCFQVLCLRVSFLPEIAHW